MDRKWSYLLLFLPLFFGLQAKAQNVLPFSDRDSGIEVFNILEDLALQLPPLDDLLDMGADFNPTIKREEALARAEEQRINVQKRLWTNHIRPFVILSQGNQGILVTGSADVFTNTVASGFLYGLNVSIPLYEFTTRGNRIKLATAEKEAALHMRDAMTIETKQEIAKAYYQLLAAQKTMVNHHEFFEKATTSEQVGELKLRENQLSLTDYTRLAEINSLARDRYYNAYADFMTAYKNLEILLGIKLSMLKR